MVQAKSSARVITITVWLLVNFSSTSIAQDLTDPEQLDRQFTVGLEALDNDQLKTARKAFQGILNVSPSLHRARVELARAYYLSMDYDKARASTQLVLDDPNTPPKVRTTLLAFLAQIDEDEKQFNDRHRWTPSIYIGAMYDSNVNVGPDREIIEIEGVDASGGPVIDQGTLEEESQETSDTAAVINLAIAHTYNPGKTFTVSEHSGFFLWQSQLSYYDRHYIDEKNFNLGVLTARTGPAWVVPRHWRASIGLQVDQIWLGTDRLALFYSVNPNVTWQFGDNWELTVDGVVTQREYHDDVDEDRDGLYRAGTVQLDRYFNKREWTLQGGVGYAKFDTDENNANAERFSYAAPDVFLGVVWQAWQNGSVYARAAWRNYDYDGVEPIFDRPRDDDEYRYSVGFQHDFKSGLLNEWQLLGSWIHTDNQSNLGIYEYDRDQVSLGLARSF